MRHPRLLLMAAAVLELLLCRQCLAGIRPSFMLDYCTWHASDIVVVSQGVGSDGQLTVLETWKGLLKRGATLSIPSLTGYTPEVSKPFGRDQEPPIKAVTGKRMVLFLTRGPKVPEVSSQPASAATQPGIAWSSASLYREMNVSMVWIENGQVYNFRQVINPGPSLLIPRDQTEEQFRKDVEAVLLTFA